jgi:hypothetical protein
VRPAVASASSSGPRSFPTWAIAGFALAAVLIGSGVTGMLVTRGRR